MGVSESEEVNDAIVQVGGTENESFAKLSDVLGEVKEVDSSTDLNFRMDWLQSRAGPHGFFTYPGTLFGADQGINVVWMVYPTPVQICCQHVSLLLPRARRPRAPRTKRSIPMGLNPARLHPGGCLLQTRLSGVQPGAPTVRAPGPTHLPFHQPGQLRLLAAHTSPHHFRMSAIPRKLSGGATHMFHTIKQDFFLHRRVDVATGTDTNRRVSLICVNAFLRVFFWGGGIAFAA